MTRTNVRSRHPTCVRSTVCRLRAASVMQAFAHGAKNIPARSIFCSWSRFSGGDPEIELRCAAAAERCFLWWWRHAVGRVFASKGFVRLALSFRIVWLQLQDAGSIYKWSMSICRWIAIGRALFIKFLWMITDVCQKYAPDLVKCLMTRYPNGFSWGGF